jgi:hypothetical protein
MYRQVFTSIFGDISIPIPPNWYRQDIEVIAFPVTEVRQEPEVDLVAERRRIRGRKWKKLFFQFHKNLQQK